VRILYIVPYSIVPADVGNKTLTYNLLRYTTRHADCDAVFVVDPRSDERRLEGAVRDALPDLRAVRFFSAPSGAALKLARLAYFARGYHVGLGRFRSRALARWLGEHARPDAYDVAHFDMVHMAPYRRSCDQRLPSVLVASDAYSDVYRKLRHETSNLGLRAHASYTYRAIRRFERRRYPEFSLVCTVAEEDTTYLRRTSPRARVATIAIPIAPEYCAQAPPAISAQPRILCIGSINHWAVARDVARFVRESFPIVRRDVPGVQLTILGRQPVRELRGVMAATPDVEHVEFVDDYRAFLYQDWVYVYPQRCGSGVQTKVLQAMGLGLPVVGFERAFSGLDINSGEHGLQCARWSELGPAVSRLLREPELRRRLGCAGSRHVATTFSIDRVGERMMELYRDVLSRPQLA